MPDNRLLAILRDGRFHSGADIGSRLSVSRSTVWKEIRKLISEGIDVHSVKGKGYRIPGGLDLLDQESIREALSETVSGLIPAIDVFEKVDSTNEVALSRARRAPSHRTVILAEQQTAGRGRRGRPWVSPYGSNLYFSLIWEFDGGASVIEGLSLAVGVTLCQALTSAGVRNLGLKWPNDLVVQGEKAGGILIELNGDLSGRCQTIIGVGLNIGMPQAAADAIDQPWVDLRSCGLAIPGRNKVAAVVLDTLVRGLEVFERYGLPAFLASWRELDVLRDQVVTVAIGDSHVEGVAAGISDDGALLLRLADGTLATFKGGEASLRRSNDPSG